MKDGVLPWKASTPLGPAVMVGAEGLEPPTFAL